MFTLTISCLLHHLLLFAISVMAGDVDLLISFKNSLENPNLLSNWNRTHGLCQFEGVTCKGGHVSSLKIQGLPLRADFSSVSAHILSLQSLETLTLHSINLTGSISAPRNCTVQLKQLDISCNNLSGSVSDSSCLAASCPSLQSLNLSNNYIGQASHNSSPVLTSLKILDLSFNKIATDREIQWLFSNLGLLKHLDLSNNNIEGTIPHITNCTSLQYLDLSTNQLSGTIPSDTLPGCLNLTYLNLSSNHFTGKTPADIEACTGLITLSLSNNNFSGEIPIQSLATVPGLQLIDLSFNNFNGSLQEHISKLKSLELLDLSANRFSGPIPRTLCTYNVSNLKVLYLQDNYFTGSIPNSLGNCTHLVSLDLSLNLLSGSIPGSLGSLSNLIDLIIWQNNLNGEIPTKLSCLKSLENLLLDYNSLTGTIPDELVNCTSLNWVSLTSNQITGSIPKWIGKLEKLGTLSLGNNSFTGSIPQELGDCKSLIYLDLNSNQLNGSIPSTLAKQSGKIERDIMRIGWPFIEILNTKNSHCQGTGSLLEFDGIRMDDLIRLPIIKYCNFTRIYMGLTGLTNAENLRSNNSMIFLDLSYNFLHGYIPTEISAMKFLSVLNLKHNNLSGPLLQELGGLTHLAILDLSHNAFEGRIPSSFSALSLWALDLSNNQLSGPIPEKGSLVTFPDAFENNSGLCGLPLPPCNSESASKGNVSKVSSTNHESSQGWWIALGLLFSVFLIIGFVIGRFIK